MLPLRHEFVRPSGVLLCASCVGAAFVSLEPGTMGEDVVVTDNVSVTLMDSTCTWRCGRRYSCGLAAHLVRNPVACLPRCASCTPVAVCRAPRDHG